MCQAAREQAEREHCELGVRFKPADSGSSHSMLLLLLFFMAVGKTNLTVALPPPTGLGCESRDVGT